MSFRGTSRFEPLAHLGTGGMGSVYRVHDRQLGSEVALKTLLQQRGIDLLRFKREFRTLADLKHPNLVELYELIRDERMWYLTMEYIRGAQFHHYVWADDPEAAAQENETDSLPSFALTIETAGDEAAWAAPLGGAPTTTSEPPSTTDVKPPDPRRLRRALLQLCRGVHTLHRAGHVHRDLKPSNVLVTPEGRVVILDFGLAQALDAKHQESAGLTGTPAFMAPEQVLDRQPQPASDWYSVGTMLYHALVGRPPFEGDLFALLAHKQWDVPLAPVEVSPGADPELSALCMELLRADPGTRPNGEALLERLDERRPKGDTAPHEPKIHWIGAPTTTPRFIGREPELERLKRSYELTRGGMLQLCLLQGPSGIGKTGLAQHFLASHLPGGRDAPLVLRGRCHERESMPFKAFDAIVDELTDYLTGLAPDVRHALLPHQRGPLAEVFPVLRRLRDVGERTITGTAVSESRAQLSRAFGAFRALFENLVDRRPVVLFVDDLQRADTDSFALLETLVEEPDAPALLIVATSRRASADQPDTAARLERLRRRSCTVTIDLAPLPADATARLARELLADARADPTVQARLADTIAREADGNPFFVAELARHLRNLDTDRWTSRELTGDDPLRLEQLVLRRVRALPKPSRQLLRLVTIAGDPLPRRLLAEALEPPLTPPEAQRAFAALQETHLIRTHGLRAEDPVEPYHDRIRELIFRSLSAGQRAALHGRIAAALEPWPRARAHRLARHWLAAAEPERARRHVLLAAGEAREMLAFARAARLYGTASRLEEDDAGRRKLRRAQAECLELSGRAVKAAETYAWAAKSAPAEEALSLKQRAAEQFLRGGQIARGVEVLQEVLEPHGLRFDLSARRAQLTVAAGLARLRLRGTGFRRRPVAELDRAERQRLDLLWAANIGLSLVDVLRADVFLLQYVFGSLDAGDRRRVAQGLAMLAAQLAALGAPFFGWAHRLADEAETLARKERDDRVLGLARMCGHVVQYFHGDFDEAATGLIDVERHFRENCHGVSWELATTRTFLCWGLRMSGRVRELVERVDRYVTDAERTGDLMVATNLRTYQSIVWLIRDDPERAARELAGALDAWPKDLYQVQHFFHLYARCEQALYLETPEQAWESLEAERSVLERSGLLKVSGIRLEHARIRGRVALAVAETLPPRSRRPYLRKARRCARILAAGNHELSHAMSALLEAGVHNLGAGDTSAKARASLERAVSIAERVPSRLLAAAGRRRLGQLSSGETDSLVEADRRMREQGVVNPAQLTRLLVPGFDVEREEATF